MMNKAPLLFTLGILVVYYLIRIYSGSTWLPLLVFGIPLGLLIFNLMIRKSLKFKSWFLNSINFILERKVYSKKSEISMDLLYDKIIEVIDHSEFQLFDTDENSYSILCGTFTNFWTWGENIYIQLDPIENDTISIQFVSTTLFGGWSWKRNQNNYESFISSFEDSLTI